MDNNISKVLLIEDESGIQELFTEYFSNQNCKLTVASNVSEAWASLVRDPYALVISDMNLGYGGNGMQVYDLCKKHLLNIPEYLFMSANHYEYEDFFKKNNLNVLQKPIDWEAIDVATNESIERSKLHQTPRRYVRFKTSASANLVPATIKANIPVDLVNYSKGGILARVGDLPLKANEMCRVEFKLPNEKSLAGLSVVKWYRPDVSNPELSMAGLEFIEFSKGDENWIEEAVSSLTI